MRVEFARRRGRAVLTTVLGAYAQVYFSRRAVPGMLFLAATWVVPARGLAGLVGLVLACWFARLLGHSCDPDGDRFFGFNGLLVGLALSLYLRPSPAFFALLVVAELLVTMMASALANLSQRYLGLPVLSLPFMFATWLALLAARLLPGVEIAAATTPVVELRAEVLPPLAAFFLRSLAAAFFQTEVVPGILVAAGLLWSSRWGALLAALGLLAGTLTWVGLGGALADLRYQLMELNFVLTAIAVGGVRIVLRPASMLAAAAAGALSAVMAAAAVALLQPLYLPVLTLPFVLTTQLFLYAVYLRTTPGRLEPVRGELDNPEGNLRRARIRERGLIDGAVPLVFLPILGRWQVTQGPGGDRTHQGLWAHAWDFEVTGEDGRTFRDHGLRPSDYYAFGAPVVAPGDGEVVRVIDHLEDNPIHEVDTTHCWGNLVIVRHAGGLCSALCHLQKGSVTVGEGAAVIAGELLGRVGNSGRSPVPHLHYQLQASAEVGAAACYCELIHYLTPEEHGSRYVTRGVPVEGQSVMAMPVEEAVRDAASLAPGRCWQWTVLEAGRRRREAWHSEIDSLGRRRLVDAAGDAEVTFFADRHHLAVIDYRGRPNRLLGLLYLGMPRLPYLGNGQVGWNDSPDVTAFMSRPMRWVDELALPFRRLAGVRTSSRCRPGAGGRIEVVTELASAGRRLGGRRLPDRIGRLPDRIVIELAPQTGPRALRSYQGDRLVLSATCESLTYLRPRHARLGGGRLPDDISPAPCSKSAAHALKASS